MQDEKYFEQIFDEYRLVAIIIYSEFQQEGIRFFTPDNFSQQLAYMKRPVGYKIQSHLHNEVARNVKYTLETLVIKKGKLRVDFYNEQKEFICSRELKGGDIALLVSGGHGFEMLEETEIVEIKQGPYAGEDDKIRF